MSLLSGIQNAIAGAGGFGAQVHRPVIRGTATQYRAGGFWLKIEVEADTWEQTCQAMREAVERWATNPPPVGNE